MLFYLSHLNAKIAIKHPFSVIPELWGSVLQSMHCETGVTKKYLYPEKKTPTTQAYLFRCSTYLLLVPQFMRICEKR